MAKVKKEKEVGASAPAITFAESEIKDVSEFINYMYVNFHKDMTPKEAMALAGMFSKMHKHIGKMEEHIFELKRVIK